MKTSCILLLLALFLISAEVTWILVTKESIIEYNVTAEIGDVTSLNPSGNLEFMLKQGETATKTVTFSNAFFSFVLLNITSSGNVSELLSYENTEVSPFSTRKVPITLNAVRKGGYSGKIIIHATRFL
jgi:hypothetical protein